MLLSALQILTHLICIKFYKVGTVTLLKIDS